MAKQIAQYQEGESMQLFALLKEAAAKTTSAGKPYLALTISDASGEISGMRWDATPDEIKQLQAGKVVSVKGQRETYRDRPQIKIDSIRLATESEPHDPLLFVPRAPETTIQLKAGFREFFYLIDEPVWRKIAGHLFSKHGEKLFSYPAAKSNHHAFVGGLAFHTLSILRLARSVVGQYPNVNAALLYTGAMLHDLGKTIELSGPIATQYTVMGNLIGHISLLDGEIVQACDELGFDPESPKVVLLRHMILSHHGLLEYGSPSRPQLLEAEILHHLDELDASIMTIQTALNKTAPGEYTDRLFSLDNRRFYRPTNEETLKKS
ncbi:HD domain-containing protein [Limosilactobacillus mucosae]|uniref:HD domain-containing protein n=1 Tax=Limosilactobacillus mucosae TaxID=97478 RepID=A0AAJ1MBP3_LIMMU|nr:HD domain-containing protein [Limosilactobacillus mucosae]MDC2830309.1 HD domain-containing protein [Limosilactobacillus mucosae]MDC2837881.1 HD domain-containing protein [Limosilactobacillus mucosae]MDC2849896.1 HD domain-containing protein [Limosilactobacillus mucosae]MDC2854033.1 HD domain-containing protein [Limosilactobacillus mucosae]